MVRPLFLSLSCAVMVLSLAGCETGYPIRVKDPQLVAQPDRVSMMLAQAADKASNALEALAAVEQKRTPAGQVPAIIGAPPELNRAITINWVGPVDQIVKRRDVIGAFVLIFQVVGVFPNVEGEQWRAELFGDIAHKRVVLIGCSADEQFFVLTDT